MEVNYFCTKLRLIDFGLLMSSFVFIKRAWSVKLVSIVNKL